MTKMQSLEKHFKGGRSNQNQLGARPTSAHLRSRTNKMLVSSSSQNPDNMRFDGNSKFNRPVSHYGTGFTSSGKKKTLSTTAVTNPTYNATLMSGKFRGINKNIGNYTNQTNGTFFGQPKPSQINMNSQQSI